jgi:hypothetical protein
VQVANFIRIAEGKSPPAAGGRGGPGPAAGPPAGGRAAAGGRAGAGGGGRGAQPETPAIGRILTVKSGLINGVVVSDIQKSVAVPSLPKATNAALKHDAPGVLGLSAPNAFYLTLQQNASLDRKYTAIGKVIAGLGLLQDIKRDDAIRSIRITRVGQAARDFKTDDEAFSKLVAEAKTKKK